MLYFYSAKTDFDFAMNMKKTALLGLVLLVFSFGCEKDDICSETTLTTPRLIIDFYDFTNPTLNKNVTNLAIIGEGMTTPYQVYNGVSKIEVPLDVAQNLSKYQFVLNYDNSNPDFINTDWLEFDYSRSQVYVSRACGYKTLFDLNDTTPFIHTDSTTPDGLWMRNITVVQPAISNEDETHLEISF